MDQVTVPRARLQQALHVATAAAYPVALIAALRAALEQPKPPPEAQTEAERLAYCAGWWAAMEQKREQPVQEPVEPLKGWKLNHARKHPDEEGVAEIGYLDPEDDRFAPILTVDTGLYYQDAQALPLAVAILSTLSAHPPRRDPLTVTELQQALVDTDLVDADAIDDPEGFDNGFTLQQIDALHSRLMQTTPPTTTPQPEPK
jgi:hypothetical protein